MEKDIRVNNFDLLRILAAFQVMVGHTVWHLEIPEPVWWRVWESFPGVPIFFVISGFLISLSYERSRDLQSYARNRVFRIYPALWCCILVTILAAAYFGISFINWQAPFWALCQFIGATYTPRFLESFGFGSYNGSLWTIPVELQFYVALPILYWALRGSKNSNLLLGIVWLVFFVIGLTLRLTLPRIDPEVAQPLFAKLIGYTFLPYFYLFLTGVLLQRLGAYRWKIIEGKGAYWLSGYLAFHFTLPGSPAATVASMLFLAVTTISIAYTATGISHRVLRGNDISYGVYIYHGLLINVLVELELIGKVEYVFLLIGCTLMVAYMSWVVVERPFLRRKKHT